MPDVRVAPAQRVGEGEGRLDVAGGPSAGDDDVPAAPRLRSCAGRRRRDASGRAGARGERRAPPEPRARPGEGHQHAEREHRDEQRRSAVGHQRQRHAGDGQQAEDRADVDQRLHR